jgi:hypothetical protein
MIFSKKEFDSVKGATKVPMLDRFQGLRASGKQTTYHFLWFMFPCHPAHTRGKGDTAAGLGGPLI